LPLPRREPLVALASTATCQLLPSRHCGRRRRGAYRSVERYLSYTHSTGTTPTHTIAGLGAAVGYMQSFGQHAIAAHNLSLRDLTYRGLCALR
jgi:aspartate aminotransferase-like enzyme